MRTSFILVLVCILQRVRSASDPTAPSQVFFANSEMSSQTSKSISAIIAEKGSADEALIRALNTEEALAEVLARQKQKQEAETILRDSLKVRQTVLGQTTDDEGLRRIMNNLCGVIGDDRMEEKETLQRQVLEGDRRTLGEEDPGTIVSMSNLSNYLSRLGKHEEAEDLMRNAIRLSESLRGPNHPETANLIDNLRGILKDAGKTEESKQLLVDRPAMEQKVEERLRRHDDKEQSRREELAAAQTDAEKMDALRKLAIYFEKEGRYSEAEGPLQQLVELSTNVKGAQDPDVQGNMHHLAHVVRTQRKFDDAERILRNLLTIQKASL